jgi:hypothetical protein
MRKKKHHQHRGLDMQAAWSLQSGPKSFPCPPHDAMDNDAANATDAAPDNDGDGDDPQ